MPQLPPYIPARDANYVNWLINFATLIAAAPASYGLTAGDATTISAANTAMSAAYALVVSPSTKTAATVQAKNTEKVISLQTVRPYAQVISKNAGVSSSAKIALGVNPNTSVPVPITVPTTSPTLSAQSTSTAGTILRFRDSTSSPSVKAKPYGVTQIQIFAAMSATPITDPTAIPFVEVATKSPLTLALGAGDAGKTVYFTARWMTRKGLVGPYASIISYVVAG